MRKNITLIISSVLFLGFTKAQTPYSAKITNSTSGVYTDTHARICKNNSDSATIEAYGGWPFGTMDSLIVPAGQQVAIPGGQIYDYAYINIAATATLVIGPDSGQVTFIGCRGTFILNGTILANQGQHAGVSYTISAPDSAGNINTNGEKLIINVLQDQGGNGGNSNGGYGEGTGEGSGGIGGNAAYGNGGGGAGGGCGAKPSSGGAFGGPGNNGNNALKYWSGSGGVGVNSLISVDSVQVYSNNGPNQITNSNNSNGGYIIVDPGQNGGCGGSRGMHGQILYIKALSGISGTGTINVSGNNGGNGGGACAGINDEDMGCSCGVFGGGGGGGGGGAGGSGGMVFIRYAGSAPSITIDTASGLGGQGGTNYANSGYNYFVIGTVGDPGQRGNPGSFSIAPIDGFTYQWRKNGTNVVGATNYLYYAKVAGDYDCKIKNLSTGIFYLSSGSLGLKKDTVFVDTLPVANLLTSGIVKVCAGDSVKLSAQYISGQTYGWLFNSNPIGTVATDYYYASLPGLYQVVTDNSCLNPNVSLADTVKQLSSPPQPTITATGNTTFCAGDSIELSSSFQSNYLWNTGATTQNIYAKFSGAYNVSTQGSNGCSSSSNGDIVTVKPASVNAGHDTAISCGGSIQLNAVCTPSSPTSVMWNPSTYLNNATIVNPICTPTTNVTYTITAMLNNGCEASDSVEIINNPASTVHICVVTVDTLSKYNVIIWNKTGLTRIDSFKVYYEDYTSHYTVLGRQLYSAPSQFTDSLNDPNSKTVRYKVTAIDSCGNEEALSVSPYHNTIYILNTSGTFQWLSGGGGGYQVEGVSNPVKYYRLMRDTLSNGNWDSINYVSGTQTSITDPNYSKYSVKGRWRIESVFFDSIISNCAYSGDRPEASNSSISRSNTSHNGTFTGINAVEVNHGLSVYPNPASTILNVNTGNSKIINGEITICDVTGRVLEEANTMLSQGNVIQVKISDLPQGVYFLQLITPSYSQVVKFVKE